MPARSHAHWIIGPAGCCTIRSRITGKCGFGSTLKYVATDEHLSTWIVGLVDIGFSSSTFLQNLWEYGGASGLDWKHHSQPDHNI